MIKRKLESVILSELEEIEHLRGDEKIKEIDNFVKLDTMLSKHLELEQTNRKNKYDEDVASFEVILRTFLGVTEIIIPLWFYNKMSNKFLTFEKEGCVTSLLFRNFIGKLRPFK